MGLIHKFVQDGDFYVIDVNSGSVHIVDNLVYDLLDEESLRKDEELIKDFKDKYSEEEIKEALKEVLSKDDVDEKYVRDFLKCSCIDRDSDKIDLDKILFIYKYGSKKAKKIAVDEKLRTI